MFKQRPPIRLLYVLIGLAFGASLGPSLSSCNVTGTKTDYSDSEFQHLASSLSHIDRFEAAYNKYVMIGPKNDKTHAQNMDQFRDALMRVRYEYVRDVPVSDLVDSAIEGMESEVSRDMFSSQEEYEAGINTYVEMMQSQQPNLDAEMEALGENANSRVDAVNAWASKNFPPEEFEVISGPYNSINLVKNDYIELKIFGFEELDIYINE